MDKQLTVFENEGQKLEAVEIDGVVWFVANEVAGILGIRNSRQAIADFDDDERLTYEIYTAGQRRLVNMVSESGLYKLVILSRKPGAKLFQRWVTHDVLPSIRKTGKYQVKELTKIEWIEACLQAEKDKQALQEKLALDAPKVAGYEALMDSTGNISMGKAGNILGVGRNTLFEKLRKIGYLMESNRPYQKYLEQELFVVKAVVVNGFNTSQTFLTPKGLDKIRKELQ